MEMAEIIASLRRALELGCKTAEDHCKLGRALYDAGVSYPDTVGAGCKEDGTLALRRACEIWAEDLNVHNKLGEALLQSEDFPGAIQAFERTLELDGTDAFALRSVGIAHANAGDLDASIAALKRALALDAKDAAATGLLREALAAWAAEQKQEKKAAAQ